jgi:glutathione S-transferase
MKLLGSAASPYVRKVRVMLAEKKLEAPLVMEQVWAADTGIAHHNPLGKVPCLLLEGGDVLYDSRVIVEYLDTLSPVGKLIPASGRERAEIKTWEALADGILDAAVLIRLENTFDGRSESQRSPAWIARQRAKVDRGLDAIARGLADKPYCAGIHLTLADLAVGCALLWLDYRFPDIAWRSRHANLARLADKLAARQSFVDTQPPPL